MGYSFIHLFIIHIHIFINILICNLCHVQTTNGAAPATRSNTHGIIILLYKFIQRSLFAEIMFVFFYSPYLPRMYSFPVRIWKASLQSNVVWAKTSYGRKIPRPCLWCSKCITSYFRVFFPLASLRCVPNIEFEIYFITNIIYHPSSIPIINN